MQVRLESRNLKTQRNACITCTIWVLFDSLWYSLIVLVPGSDCPPCKTQTLTDHIGRHIRRETYKDTHRQNFKHCLRFDFSRLSIPGAAIKRLVKAAADQTNTHIVDGKLQLFWPISRWDKILCVEFSCTVCFDGGDGMHYPRLLRVVVRVRSSNGRLSRLEGFRLKTLCVRVA